MRTLIILFLGAFALLSSCSDKLDKAMEGSWSIDTIYYKGYDVRVCLSLNVLTYHGNYIADLPVAHNRCETVIKNSTDRTGSWEIVKSSLPNDTIPLRMKFVTGNELFAGTHKIVFYKDLPNKLLKMEIYSDDLYIVARKGLFNFDSNIKMIDYLEKISWTNRRY